MQFCRFHKFHPGGGVVKQIPHHDGGTQGTARFLHLAEYSALDGQGRAQRSISGAGHHINAGDGGEEKLVKEVKKYIDRHAAQPLTNMQIAKRFGYHPYYLGNVFLSEEGITLHKYIMDARVKNAKEKLSFTEKPISVISSEMGFKDSSYFSAFFKKVTGTTPKEYRKLYR